MGGLLGNPLGAKGSIGNGGNADDYQVSGIYGVNMADGTSSNFPEVSPLGILIVFKSTENSALGGSPILQIYFDYNIRHIYSRCKWVGKWLSWKEIQLVQ